VCVTAYCLLPTFSALLVPAASLRRDALLDVCFQNAERLFVALQRETQGMPQSLRGVKIRDDALGDIDGLSRDADRLGIQCEIDDELFGSARHAAEIRVARDGLRIVDLDLLSLRLLHAWIDVRWYRLFAFARSFSTQDNLPTK
jgi:hypothetical protein